jgi:hypothetical protein
LPGYSDLTFLKKLGRFVTKYLGGRQARFAEGKLWENKVISMKNLCTLVVFLVIAISVLGYYRDWFQFSSDSTDKEATFHLTVDKERLKEDEEKAKQQLQEAGNVLKEKAKEVTGNE